MSIYRKMEPFRRPQSDVHAEDTIQKWPVSQRTASANAGGVGGKAGDGKHQRRGAPANVLIPPTLKWVETLPPNVRPTALLRQYPRIVNLIAAAWRDPQSFDTYMDSLLTDKRGNRKGFPSEILNELDALRRYHEARNKDDNSVWGDVRRRG
jgi:hypothetical protein